MVYYYYYFDAYTYQLFLCWLGHRSYHILLFCFSITMHSNKVRYFIECTRVHKRTHTHTHYANRCCYLIRMLGILDRKWFEILLTWPYENMQPPSLIVNVFTVTRFFLKCFAFQMLHWSHFPSSTSPSFSHHKRCWRCAASTGIVEWQWHQQNILWRKAWFLHRLNVMFMVRNWPKLNNYHLCCCVCCAVLCCAEFSLSFDSTKDY